MKFSSVSGNVNVKAPLIGVGDVEMSSLSGSLDTDFPIQVQEKQFGPGRSAKGNVSGGTSNLKISIHIRQNQPAQDLIRGNRKEHSDLQATSPFAFQTGIPPRSGEANRDVPSFPGIASMP